MAGDLEKTSLIQSVIRLMDISISDGSNLETLKSILALLCLLSITTENQTVTVRESQNINSNTSPLQKILNQLSGGTSDNSNSPSPDMLMTLLPLLNNSQVKNKLSQLNPATIAAIVGMMNNMGGKQEPGPHKEASPPQQPSEPSAALTSLSEKNAGLDWTKKV